MSGSKVSAKEAASRQQYLQSLDEFINKCQEDITSMLDRFDWTPEHFMQPRNQVMCPFNSDHHMTKASLEKHKARCELISQGYSKEEADMLDEDTSYYFKDASCVYTVKLDLNTINSVLWNHHVQNHSVFYGYKKVPQTVEEEQQLMSRDDRLAVSEYIIRRAKEANRLKELGQDELLVAENLADLIKKENEERQLDPVEEMAALRDYRRRRQTYRAKNVHITNKSHTEVMREVINNQMEMYSKSMFDTEEHIKQEVSDRLSKDGSHTDRKTDTGRDERSERDEWSKRDERSRYHRRYSRSRSRSRGQSHRRSSRRSRSRDREMRDRASHRNNKNSRYDERPSREYRPADNQSTIEKSDSVNQSTHDDQSAGRESVDQSVHGDQSKSRTRSTSTDREKSRHKKKTRHRSRSSSISSDRSKKSKKKKHKHKQKKHKKQSKDSESEEGEIDSTEEK